MKKQKLQNTLSAVVLSLGLASFMVIFFYIKFVKSYDDSWEDSGQIYRVALERTLANGSLDITATNYSGLCMIVKDEIPGVESVTGFQRDIVTAYTSENYFKDANFFWCDTSFFEIFNCPFLAGNPDDPFPGIQSAVISETAALRLFGKKDPVNERFKLNEGWEFFVSGVFADIPENSHLKIDILITRKTLSYFVRNFDNKTSALKEDAVREITAAAPSSQWLWGIPQVYTYIKLQENTTPEFVGKKFSGISEKYTSHLIATGQKSKFILQPLSSIHIESHLSNELSQNTDLKTIITLWLIAILSLVMSLIIFINLQVTRVFEKAKETGLKKAFGASSYRLLSEIVLQLLIISFFGLILAVCLFFMLKGFLSGFLNLKDPLKADTLYLIRCLLLFALCAVLTSIYLGYILISKKTQFLLSEKFKQNNDGFNFRRMLILFQFTVSIGSLIATFVISRQVSYMKNKELGLKIENTAFSYTPMSMIKKQGATQKFKAFLEEVERLPEIESATLTSCVPGKEINFHSNTIYSAGHPEMRGDNFGILFTDYNFQNVFRPIILSGRLFTAEDIQGSTNLVINREACRKLGFNSPESAIGEFVNLSINDYLNIPDTPYKVCGVIEDFHQETLRKNIEPLLILNDYKWKYEVGFVSVLFNEVHENQDQFIKLRDKWQNFYPADPFSFQFTNENYKLQTRFDEKIALISMLYTVLSWILAALGLFGLATSSIQKRIKEIGIRKVCGARFLEILVMLNRAYLKLILIAFLVVAPIAWAVMHKWLENFAYRTELSWWNFIFAGVTAVGIVILTLSLQTWKAASRNPVEALRYE
jgi:putative ABC transport system permease protein